jgi:ankyrin repeat protein
MSNCNLNEVNKDLVVAAASGDDDTVDSLLDMGADPMYSDGLPILVAATKGHYDTIRLLVLRGAHGEVLRLASRIAMTNGFKENAKYLATWANMEASGNGDPKYRS